MPTVFLTVKLLVILLLGASVGYFIMNEILISYKIRVFLTGNHMPINIRSLHLKYII